MFKGVLLAQLRVQESLTLESRAKSIPLPKCKAAPKSNPKSAVKAKAEPKARAQDRLRLRMGRKKKLNLRQSDALPRERVARGSETSPTWVPC
jgi:hypothetical protein